MISENKQINRTTHIGTERKLACACSLVWTYNHNVHTLTIQSRRRRAVHTLIPEQQMRTRRRPFAHLTTASPRPAAVHTRAIAYHPRPAPMAVSLVLRCGCRHVARLPRNPPRNRRVVASLGDTKRANRIAHNMRISRARVRNNQR